LHPGQGSSISATFRILAILQLFGGSICGRLTRVVTKEVAQFVTYGHRNELVGANLQIAGQFIGEYPTRQEERFFQDCCPLLHVAEGDAAVIDLKPAQQWPPLAGTHDDPNPIPQPAGGILD